VVAGDFTRINGESRTGLAVLDENGRVQADFVPDRPWTSVSAIVVGGEGELFLIAGNCGEISRVLPDGSVDDQFLPNLAPVTCAHTLTVARDGKLMELRRYIQITISPGGDLKSAR
jgi:hypothetical protein